MVFFKEVLPNPIGEYAGSEWIKLVNTEEDITSLAGWSIKDASGKTYFLNTSINGRTELLLEYSITGITLNNTDETLTLTDSNGNVVDTLTYPQAGDDEIIIADRFLDSTAGQEMGAPTLNELAIKGNEKIVSGGELSAIAIALAIAIVSGFAVGVFIKKRQEQ